MKIAVTASESSLDAPVDPRFGRCACFLVIDTETLEFETLDNTNALQASGAGVRSAELIAKSGATIILTGNCGPKAHTALAAAGITIVTGASGTVKDAVAAFAEGKLSPSTAPNVASHFGMGPQG